MKINEKSSLKESIYYLANKQSYWIWLVSKINNFINYFILGLKRRNSDMSIEENKKLVMMKNLAIDFHWENSRNFKNSSKCSQWKPINCEYSDVSLVMA